MLSETLNMQAFLCSSQEVKMWKKQLEEKFGKNRVKIEREVEINE